jgi:hypothetical protein
MSDHIQTDSHATHAGLDTRVVNPRVPLAAHRLLKIEAAKRSVKLTECAAQLIVERLSDLMDAPKTIP